MKRQIGDIWKVKEGSRTIWKIQFPKGISYTYTKAAALLWQKQLKKDIEEGRIKED